MQSPPHIVFENMDSIERVREKIERELAKLEQIFSDIITSRVTVRQAQNRHKKGDLFAVSIHVNIPGGKDIHINRDAGKDHGHEDINVAVRDAFRAAKRQLKETARQMGWENKHREAVPLAKVGTLVAEENYGFLETDDGREIYFHRNSVLNDGYDELVVGAKVAYAEAIGDKGPQASTVRLL